MKNLNWTVYKYIFSYTFILITREITFNIPWGLQVGSSIHVIFNSYASKWKNTARFDLMRHRHNALFSNSTSRFGNFSRLVFLNLFILRWYSLPSGHHKIHSLWFFSFLPFIISPKKPRTVLRWFFA